MKEPGLDLHQWETGWQELEEQLADDPGGALPEAADLVEQVLAETDVAAATGGQHPDELLAPVRAAREVADRVERGETVDPGDLAQAVNDLRAVYQTISAGRSS